MATSDALFSAIDCGDLDEIEELLRADPTLAHHQREGISTVRAAMYAGQPAAAQLLLDAGAPEDIFDAAAIGDVDRVRELLDADAELVDARAGDGFAPLHLAAWFGHPKVAELLLARGADLEARATNGSDLRPLHSAAAGGHAVIAHLLLDRGADIEAAQSGGVRAIHSAAHRDDLAMLQLLLDRGADPSVATDDGRTPADLATTDEARALLPA